MLYSHVICRTRKKRRNDNMASLTLLRPSSLTLLITRHRDCLPQELAEAFVQVQHVPNLVVVKLKIIFDLDQI